MEEFATVLCITLCLVLAWIFWNSFQQAMSGKKQYEQNEKIVSVYNEQAARTDALLTQQEDANIRYQELLDKQDAILSRADALLSRLEVIRPPQSWEST